MPLPDIQNGTIYAYDLDGNLLTNGVFSLFYIQ